MKTDLDLKTTQAKLTALIKKLVRHAAFTSLVAVLLVYILVVWQISNLATAEPSSDAQATAATQIPKIDQKAINQIQTLEKSNTEVRSLFNQARNNPFQE